MVILASFGTWTNANGESMLQLMLMVQLLKNSTGYTAQLKPQKSFR